MFRTEACSIGHGRSSHNCAVGKMKRASLPAVDSPLYKAVYGMLSSVPSYSRVLVVVNEVSFLVFV